MGKFSYTQNVPCSEGVLKDWEPNDPDALERAGPQRPKEEPTERAYLLRDIVMNLCHHNPPPSRLPRYPLWQPANCLEDSPSSVFRCFAPLLTD